LIVVVAEPTVIVPLRAAPVLPATLYPIVPLPLPVAPEVTVIHDASLVAVQLQEAALETVIEPVLEAAAALTVVGFKVNEQFVPAAWLMVVVAEPTVIVLLRAAPVLAATLYPTVPLPAPAWPEVIVIHEAPLAAVQLQDAAPETAIEPLLAVAAALTVVGLRRNEQDAAAAWLIVAVAEPTLMVPVRAAPGLGATVNPMLALPVPVGDARVIHGTFVMADHAHVVVSDTKVPAPPAAGIGIAAGLSAYVHAGGGTGFCAAACVTANDWPAMARAELRSAPVFGSTASSTTPGPFPGDPEAMVIQLAAVVADQVHPAAVVTVTRKLPPPAPTDWAPEPDSANSHGAGACWISARMPLMTIAVCLPDAEVFGPTSTRRVALPCPDEGSIRATQLASAEAVHAHSGVVVSVTCSLPPDELTADSGPASVTLHLTTVGPVEVTDVDPQAASQTVQATGSTMLLNRRVNRQTVASAAMRLIPDTTALRSRRLWGS